METQVRTQSGAGRIVEAPEHAGYYSPARVVAGPGPRRNDRGVQKLLNLGYIAAGPWGKIPGETWFGERRAFAHIKEPGRQALYDHEHS